MTTKRDRYTLHFVIEDINCMYVDITISNYIELLNKKMCSYCFVNCFSQTKQTTRDDVHHDEKAELPDNLKHSKCERGDLAKQGGSLPPIHFIRPKAKSHKEVATMAIYTSHEVKEEFTKYAGGNTKLAVMHIWLFKSILEMQLLQ